MGGKIEKGREELGRSGKRVGIYSQKRERRERGAARSGRAAQSWVYVYALHRLRAQVCMYVCMHVLECVCRACCATSTRAAGYAVLCTLPYGRHRCIPAGRARQECVAGNHPGDWGSDWQAEYSALPIPQKKKEGRQSALPRQWLSCRPAG